MSKKPLERVLEAVARLISRNLLQIITAILFVLLGVVISWKAERGACLINCTFEDHRRNYYLENPKHIEELIKNTQN